MAKTIKELEQKLAIAKADDDDDDAMIEQLEGTVFQLKSKFGCDRKNLFFRKNRRTYTNQKSRNTACGNYDGLATTGH